MILRLLKALPLITVAKEDIGNYQKLLSIFGTASIGIILYIIKISQSAEEYETYFLVLIKLACLITIIFSLLGFFCFAGHRSKNNNRYLTLLNAWSLCAATCSFIITIILLVVMT